MSTHPLQPVEATNEPSWSPIVELRQYTLHPGQRDVLIDLFEREFIESQEELGMQVLGHFRDLDDPDRFVWIRGFHDMSTRGVGLAAFYGGPVWKQHREVANATMYDSDNVLLLRPLQPSTGFLPVEALRPPIGGGGVERGLVIAAVYALENDIDDALVDYLEQDLRPALAQAGAAVLATFVTDPSPNNYPILPVRDERVFVWFAGLPNHTIHGAEASRERVDALIPDAPGSMRPAQLLRLAPAPRSGVTGATPASAVVTPSNV